MGIPWNPMGASGGPHANPWGPTGRLGVMKLQPNVPPGRNYRFLRSQMGHRPQVSIFTWFGARKYGFLHGLVVACARPGGNQTSFLKFGVGIGTHGEPMGIHRGPHWDPWNPWGHHGDPSGPQRDPMGTHRNPSGFHGDPMRTAFRATATPSGPPGRNYRFLRSQMGHRPQVSICTWFGAQLSIFAKPNGAPGR